MHHEVLVYKMKIKFRFLMSVGVALVAISLGSLGLYFVGFHSLKLIPLISIPAGAIFIISCSILAMAGKIERN